MQQMYFEHCGMTSVVIHMSKDFQGLKAQSCKIDAILKKNIMLGEELLF